MYKKVRCTCEAVVLLIKPIVFLTLSLSSASLDLKVPSKSLKTVLTSVNIAVSAYPEGLVINQQRLDCRPRYNLLFLIIKLKSYFVAVTSFKKIQPY